MLVSSSSALRRLPSNLDPRQVLFIDAIRYCLEMADASYTRLARTLLQMAVSERPDSFPDAFLDAWSMVDSANRLRVLINRMPGVKKKAAGFQLVDRALMPFEGLRNGVQHLNETIDDIVAKGEPAWGWLTWAAMDTRDDTWRMCVAMPGTVRPTTGPESEVGAWKAPIDRIELTGYGHTVSLTRAYEAMASFVPSLEAALTEQFGELPTSASDFLLVLVLERRKKRSAGGGEGSGRPAVPSS